ncbi:hypothetical protein JZ751_002919 [Albula glossodonta]|uniref:E3 ubiquitin-protein ligase UBR7 n=1 Tax=Albula glossodonta TaxID=121402 RepID=A0A8T2NFU7_9TELE|nr:hypothetical protein JZ751_002919 [Albula glossodonta]
MAVHVEDEHIVSLVDVLQKEEDIENEAFAVLGGSDPEKCSYPRILDEMIQCIICEDWFHCKHLGCEVAECEELQEMVCESCMNKAPLLWTYASHLAVTKVSPCETEVEVNVEEDDMKKEENIKDHCADGGEKLSTRLSSVEEKSATNGKVSTKRSHQEMQGSPLENKPKKVECKLQRMEGKGLVRPRKGAVFWPYVWRSKLCTCINCKKAYVEVGVPFLLDESDTVLAYENRAKAELETDALMSTLNRLDHVQQLEIIYEYNDMKTELKDYLQRFAEEGKVVTPTDIQNFFEELQSRKRQRTNEGQPFCS